MNNQWLQHGPVSNKFRQTYIKGFLDVSGNTIIRNGSIHLTDGDISMNGAIFNNGTDIITQITDTSNNLFDFKTRVDTSLNTITTNLVTTDTSLNLVTSNLVTTDTSLNTITSNLVTTDASLNLVTSNLVTTDASLNILVSNLVTTDTSLNLVTTNLVTTDASLNTLTGIVDLKRDIGNLVFDGSMQLAGNIIPNTTGIYDIGTSAKRFRSIYVDEAHLSVNTLYIGDTAILGTNANTIEIKADVNQSIDVSTTGSGSSKLQSEYDVSILTSGTNADVKVQATGTNSKVRLSGTGGVEFSSNVEAQANVLIGGNLTVTGNVVSNGSQFTVNSTTVTTADNVIVLNKGEVGTGVTSGISGIQIDRGDGSDFQLVFDEAIDKLKAGFIDGAFGIIATESYVDASINTLATRVTTTETDIGILDVSMTSVESRITTTETDISILDVSMTSIEGLLDLKANDVDVVHKTGTETIGGNKTFSGTTTFSGNISANNATITPTVLGYLDGATSNIQQQIDNVAAMGGGANLVHIDGVETITGAKTFTNDNFLVENTAGDDKINVNGLTTTLTNTNINVNGKLTIYGNIEQIYSSTANSLYVTSIGHQTLGGSSGSYSVNRSVLLGYQAGYNMASGGHAEDNIFIGYQSGYNVGGGTASNANIGIGYKTLFNSSSTYSRYNTIIGYDAGSGGQNSSNTIVGYTSGKSIVGAAENALFGDQTGKNITTGSKNTLIGSNAGAALETGLYNTLIGKSVAFTMTTASSNTAMGYQSLGLTTGSNNTAYGYYSGRTLTTGSNNIIIGYNSQPSSATVSNEVTIGTTSTGIFRMNSSGATITGQNVVLNFTGQHHNYGINETVDEKGFIVSSTGKYRNQMTNCDECNKYKITINESLPIVEYSQQVNDTKVWGVISDKDDTNTTRQQLSGNIISLYEQAEEDRPLVINSLGEGAVWVSNMNGPILNGDYITTGQLPGLGVKQDDDILHSYTVAKITTDCSFDETEIVPRKKLRYETITKTREKTIEVEKDVFDYWEDDFNDETYYENFERQIIDKVSKIIQEDIITYDVSGIPSVQVIEKTVEEEVPRVTHVESTDASGNITITEVPTMETVSITKTRNIPIMIDVILKDASNNNLLDSQGDPIIKQYQAKKPVYKKEIINETITETYDIEMAVIDPVTMQYVYDYETDNSGNIIYVEKYEMKYIIVDIDKYSIYNDKDYTTLYKEFKSDFTNTQINGDTIIGKTYKMAFLGCTYHCG